MAVPAVAPSAAAMAKAILLLLKASVIGSPVAVGLAVVGAGSLSPRAPCGVLYEGEVKFSLRTRSFDGVHFRHRLTPSQKPPFEETKETHAGGHRTFPHAFHALAGDPGTRARARPGGAFQRCRPPGKQ